MEHSHRQQHLSSSVFTLTLTAILMLAGCASDAPSGMNGGGGEAAGGGAGSENYGPSDASSLFAPSALPTFDLSLPAERWQYLQEHARDEEYEPADLVFQGDVVGQVGLRFKGSIGTLENCFDGEGNLVCRKLSMKLKFDEYATERRFYGLKRVNLHSMIFDATLMHEKLAYDLYREMGVDAPRSSWAIARVNGVSLGIFSLVEEVDGRFTDDRFPGQGDGNLYKEAWPDSENPDDYADALETNEDTATHEAFAAFAADLHAAADPAAQRAALARWTDLERLARYMAVDDAIANIDGITAIYCSPDEPAACGNHNSFFYLSEDQARFQLIPWDLDSTFWPQTIYDNVPAWQVDPGSCEERYPIGSDDATLVPPGCDPFFTAMAADLSDYDQAFETLLDGPFSVAAAEAAIDRHAVFLVEAVAAEPNGQSVERWQAELAMLKHNIPVLHARARARRSGFTASAFELSLDRVNDFEALDSEILPLLPSFSNPGTTTRMSLVGASAGEPALEGAKSLRLSFEYGNDGVKPWGQWINLALAFRARPRNISEFTGVRLKLRTDGPRVVRVDLDSRGYEAGIEGIKFGWELQVDSSPLTVELPLASASLPSWARATLDDLAIILQRVDGLAFQPMCNGRDDAGLLPEGATDPGFVELDAIELY